MTTLQALRGTRDILPDEIAYWQLVETTARDILTRANYQEIRTPIFEQTELFQRGIGEATDVVGKEMYSFSDRGDRSLTLRPEGTAGVVRAYIEHNLFAAGGVQRLWYTGPMFRYERPQAGRQRQFHQIGLELLGTDAPRADAEVIALASDILQALGLKKTCISPSTPSARETIAIATVKPSSTTSAPTKTKLTPTPAIASAATPYASSTAKTNAPRRSPKMPPASSTTSAMTQNVISTEFAPS